MKNDTNYSYDDTKFATASTASGVSLNGVDNSERHQQRPEKRQKVSVGHSSTNKENDNSSSLGYDSNSAMGQMPKMMIPIISKDTNSMNDLIQAKIHTF